jgi:hypothetical protein
MALLQALLAFVGRSAGKILYAVFGWAVRALFGFTAGARRVLLTGVVALAALWPLLIVGVAFPRVAALAVAFVPISEDIDEGWLRGAWIALALLVPVGVGIALATQSPGAPSEPPWKRLARGYPVTLGVAAAFWISFVSVPIQRAAAAMRGLKDAYVPLITTAASYFDAAERVRVVLDDHGFELRPTEPDFWTRAPLTILRVLGGPALRDFVPERLAQFRGPSLFVVLHPSGLLLRGRERDTTLAHGLCVEALTDCDAYQTVAADSQRLEREIRQVWHRLEENPTAHRGSVWLRGRVDDIAGELARSDVPYDDWQITYRQVLQLDRALRGEPQVFGTDSTRRGEDMSTWTDPSTVRMDASRPRALPLTQLLREIAAKSALLARKEMELARTEATEDLGSELSMVRDLGVAAVFAISTLDMLLVALVFLLTPQLEGWQAALIVAGGTLLVAVVTGLLGWRRRVRHPLERTRRTLDEDLKWGKERLA